jgi:hypothetical protein
MNTNVTQVKVSLPGPLFDYASSKAGKFGITLSSYIRNLILNDVKDMDYPVHHASTMTEESYQNALRERSDALEVKDLDTFFKSL